MLGNAVVAVQLSSVLTPLGITDQTSNLHETTGVLPTLDAYSSCHAMRQVRA